MAMAHSPLARFNSSRAACRRSCSFRLTTFQNQSMPSFCVQAHSNRQSRHRGSRVDLCWGAGFQLAAHGFQSPQSVYFPFMFYFVRNLFLPPLTYSTTQRRKFALFRTDPQSGALKHVCSKRRTW